MAARVKVLVVEDDDALRKVLELRLTLEGFDVVLAADGEKGLEALAVCRPDCAITDLMMPHLDGYGFCRRARQTRGFERLPIVLLTAHQRDTDVDDLLELGGIVYMNKPFDAPTLTALLREIVADPDPARHARAS